MVRSEDHETQRVTRGWSVSQSREYSQCHSRFLFIQRRRGKESERMCQRSVGDRTSK